MEAALEFLERFAALGGPIAKNERFIFCGFPGDPTSDNPRKWRPRPWRPGDPLPINPGRTNGYLAISTFVRNERGEFRRIQELFSRCRCLMVDDVGDMTSSSNRVPLDRVAHLPPTFRVETSPGNEQWLYVFEEPLDSRGKAASLIDAFVAQRLIDGTDPGMKGVNRVFRLPGFVNGKTKYNGWRVRLLGSEGPVYSLPQILKGFGLVLRSPPKPKRLPPSHKADRVAAYRDFYLVMLGLGILKRNKPNLAGWTDIQCPWVDEHTGGADNGSGIREPNPENEWYGAFHCHHGHCLERTWADLTDRLAELIADELNQTNEANST